MPSTPLLQSTGMVLASSRLNQELHNNIVYLRVLGSLRSESRPHVQGLWVTLWIESGVRYILGGSHRLKMFILYMQLQYIMSPTD